MKCRFCGVELEVAAVSCNSCGATLVDGAWSSQSSRPQKAPVPVAARKGRFTLRSTGVLLLASAAFEVFSVGTPAPLFGALREGPFVVLYHLLFVAIYVVMGIGLWWAKPWGYRVVLGGCALSIVDKLLLALDRKARWAALSSQLGDLERLSQLVSVDLIDQLIVVVMLTLIGCWIGFAIYVRLRRDYFCSRVTQ